MENVSETHPYSAEIMAIVIGLVPLMVRQTKERIHYEKSGYRQGDGVSLKLKVDHIEIEKLEVDNSEVDSLSIHHKGYQKAYYAFNTLLKHLS